MLSTIHVLLMLNVQLTVTGHSASVLQDTLVTHTAAVCPVSLESVGSPADSFTYFSTFLVFQGECKIDTDCPDNKACINNQCLDPCNVYDPCGKNAQCETTSHRPVCRCPSGWAGDPHTECYQCRLDLLVIRLD